MHSRYSPATILSRTSESEGEGGFGLRRGREGDYQPPGSNTISGTGSILRSHLRTLPNWDNWISTTFYLFINALLVIVILIISWSSGAPSCLRNPCVGYILYYNQRKMPVQPKISSYLDPFSSTLLRLHTVTHQQSVV